MTPTPDMTWEQLLEGLRRAARKANRAVKQFQDAEHAQLRAGEQAKRARADRIDAEQEKREWLKAISAKAGE